jgi:nitrogen fixation-related uncharacterized protein
MSSFLLVVIVVATFFSGWKTKQHSDVAKSLEAITTDMKRDARKESYDPQAPLGRMIGDLQKRKKNALVWEVVSWTLLLTTIVFVIVCK